MEENYVRWAIWASFGIFILTILAVGLYIFTPMIMKFLSGVDSCYSSEYTYSQSPGIANVKSSIISLCNSARAFLGIAIMIEIILGSLISVMATGLGVIHLFENKNVPDKVLYLALMILFGFIGVWYYLKNKPEEATLIKP